MTRNQKRKLFGSSSKASPVSTKRDGNVSARLPSDYPPPNLTVEGVRADELLTNLIDYQLTVRPKVELDRYSVSMLLEMTCWEALDRGIDFVLWITIEYLSSYLLGSRKVWEVRDKNERRVVTLAHLLLLTCQNSWLDLRERIQVPNEIQEYIYLNALISSKRALGSRKSHWVSSKYLEVRTVRLDVFLEREDSSVRYSSYCKGYGEGSSKGRRQKTKPSAELDGEDMERPEVILSLRDISNLLYLNLMEIQKMKFRR